MQKLEIKYSSIITPEHVWGAYEKFCKGKGKRRDVIEFDRHREKHLFALIRDLAHQKYVHGGYEEFIIHDPKRRVIHKATVRDRIVHQILYDILAPYFGPRFITHSYSSRIGKGSHRAIDTFREISRQVSHNFTTSCYVLKCDIRRFFASIDHHILISLLETRIVDRDILDLTRGVIYSFDPEVSHRGIPLGNLTSQIFGNIYLNELDQYMRHTLRIPEYIRYADDFVIFAGDQDSLREILTQIQIFISDSLYLELHPEKIFLESLYSGVDWLGWQISPHHRVMRTKTKRRMISRLPQKYRDDPENFDSIFQSYLTLMSHWNTYQTERGVREQYGYIL